MVSLKSRLEVASHSLYRSSSSLQCRQKFPVSYPRELARNPFFPKSAQCAIKLRLPWLSGVSPRREIQSMRSRRCRRTCLSNPPEVSGIRSDARIKIPVGEAATKLARETACCRAAREEAAAHQYCYGLCDQRFGKPSLVGHVCSRWPRKASLHAANARGGAMNSGPTGSLMLCANMRSISAMPRASICHPSTSLMAVN